MYIYNYIRRAREGAPVQGALPLHAPLLKSLQASQSPCARVRVRVRVRARARACVCVFMCARVTWPCRRRPEAVPGDVQRLYMI